MSSTSKKIFLTGTIAKFSTNNNNKQSQSTMDLKTAEKLLKAYINEGSIDRVGIKNSLLNCRLLDMWECNHPDIPNSEMGVHACLYVFDTPVGEIKNKDFTTAFLVDYHHYSIVFASFNDALVCLTAIFVKYGMHDDVAYTIISI